jgi:hypothetical protein
MRTHVSKVFAGSGIDPALPPGSIFDLTEGQIAVFDWDSKTVLDASNAADYNKVGFARGMGGGMNPLLTGPVDARKSIALFTAYRAVDKPIKSLDTIAVPDEGVSAIFKVVTHTEVGVAPNKIFQVAVSIVGKASESPEEFAVRLKAEFDKNNAENGGAKRFDVTVSGSNPSKLNFEPFTTRNLDNGSDYPYDGITRPEFMYIEIGAPNRFSEEGEYVVSTYQEAVPPHGYAKQIMWLEDVHMGRMGFSDRVSWQDKKKYQYQAKYNTTYDTVVISGDLGKEGDMQATRQNPVGVILALVHATNPTFILDILAPLFGGNFQPVSSGGPGSGSTLDMDHDGDPDTEVFDDGTIHVTEDSDSINIDIDGDDDADIVIPK